MSGHFSSLSSHCAPSKIRAEQIRWYIHVLCNMVAVTVAFSATDVYIYVRRIAKLVPFSFSYLFFFLVECYYCNFAASRLGLCHSFIYASS